MEVDGMRRLTFFALPYFFNSWCSFFLCRFQPFQLPLCFSFHFTCFLFFSTFNKRFVGYSKQNDWLPRFSLASFVFHTSL
jgi:hypothetical protein